MNDHERSNRSQHHGQHLHGHNGRAIILDEDTRQRLMHLRRQTANIIKLAMPVLDELENLLELPADKRIRIEP